MLVPSYWAFALGFVLWGARGVLGSGAPGTLVHEELERLGAAGRYARAMGRARAAGLVAAMAATGLAGPVFALGGHPAVGAASVLSCLAAVAVASRFPEHRAASRGRAGDWAATLRAGAGEVRRDRSLRGALLLVPAVGAVRGRSTSTPRCWCGRPACRRGRCRTCLLLIWAGATAGSLLAGACARLGRTGFAALLTGVALALAAGAAMRTPAGLGLVAVAFGGFQLATVLADVRL